MLSVFDKINQAIIFDRERDTISLNASHVEGSYVLVYLYRRNPTSEGLHYE